MDDLDKSSPVTTSYKEKKLNFCLVLLKSKKKGFCFFQKLRKIILSLTERDTKGSSIGKN